MNLHRKPFWLGFLSGALLVGIAALYMLNGQARTFYILQAIAAPSHTDSLNRIRVALETGNETRAENVHRTSAWFYQNSFEYNSCMSEKLWHLWLSNHNECEAVWEKPMPDDFQPFGLEKERDRRGNFETTGLHPESAAMTQKID